MTRNTTPAATVRPTPTQKTVMLTGSSIRPTPPTTKPTRPTTTAVQAAGVLPWFADIRSSSAVRRAVGPSLVVVLARRVAAVVEDLPEILGWAVGRRVVAAAHLRPALDEP